MELRSSSRQGGMSMRLSSEPTVSFKQTSKRSSNSRRAIGCPPSIPREFVEAGGLVAYAINYPDMYYSLATFIDKILRGEKPSELPVEQPTRFELVINGTTAKRLGLQLPPTLLARADEVIE